MNKELLSLIDVSGQAALMPIINLYQKGLYLFKIAS
jgi:hypothetical protein